MAIKTRLSRQSIETILKQYNLGRLVDYSPISQGSIQTNFLLYTITGKYVLRYYENRSVESVLFESDLLAYLKKRNYPCAGMLLNQSGNYTGIYRDKPYVILEFIKGQHIDHPKQTHKLQLIKNVAELQVVTRDFCSAYQNFRWNYNPALCLELASVEAQKTNTDNALIKLFWIEHQLLKLDIPDLHPKGICHCDFHFSNVLFQDDRFAGLIDFDDANFTYLTFDLICLIDSWAWPFQSETVNFQQAREIVQEYEKHRSLNSLERQHLFDVHKLSILFDCVWYFGRGSGDAFYERKKIGFLDTLGRDRYEHALFSD